jgi:hypothetical protein
MSLFFVSLRHNQSPIIWSVGVLVKLICCTLKVNLCLFSALPTNFNYSTLKVHLRLFGVLPTNLIVVPLMLTRALFFLLVTLSIPSTRPSFHPWGAVKPQRRTARPCPDQTMVSSRCRNKDESFEADHSYIGSGAVFTSPNFPHNLWSQRVRVLHCNRLKRLARVKH